MGEIVGKEPTLGLSNKDKYEHFCDLNKVPIYSKPWWMDAVCGEDNWDVWIYEKGNNILAAMPYYMEQRGEYRYITKAPLTQNNGIIFNSASEKAKLASRLKYEEEVIDKACDFISSLGVDVYEQQYQTGFSCWLPFFWNHYTSMTRYTYVIGNTSDLGAVWDAISSKQRSIIRKGERNTTLHEGLDIDVFYKEHEKIFLKQGLQCPFPFKLWARLFEACSAHDSSRILYRATNDGSIASIMFLVWDDKRVYQLLGGSIPEFQNLDSYETLIWDGIQFAHEIGRKYDFEGSVIKRISKSFREFGGMPEPYFRIRKVFNPEVLELEHLKQKEHLINDARPMGGVNDTFAIITHIFRIIPIAASPERRAA